MPVPDDAGRNDRIQRAFATLAHEISRGMPAVGTSDRVDMVRAVALATLNEYERQVLREALEPRATPLVTARAR